MGSRGHHGHHGVRRKAMPEVDDIILESATYGFQPMQLVYFFKDKEHETTGWPESTAGDDRR